MSPARGTHERLPVGKILGALGLLLLLSSPFTLFFTSGSVALTAAKAVAGLVLLGVYFATNFKQFGQFATRRSSFFFGTTRAAGAGGAGAGWCARQLHRVQEEQDAGT